MTSVSVAAQAACRSSTYRQHRTDGRKTKYGRFSVSPRPEIYRNLRIKDSVKIDPPYNTDNDFIYRDDFGIDREEYKEQHGIFDEDSKRLLKNTDSNGCFHSDWCSMIYSRLLLSRNLLTDDGVIFISLLKLVKV